jgi:acyl-CoA thioesterase I
MPRNSARAPAILFAVATLFAAAGAWAAAPSCPVTPPVRIDLQATRVALFHARPVTIVALGSSSTEGVGASAPDRTYPERLAAILRAAWPNVPVTVLNKGIGGEMVDSELKRIDTDVLPEQPQLVIWQIGTNEVLRGMEGARFAARLDEGVQKILASGADVVLMDNQIAPRVREDRSEVFDALIAHETQAQHISLFSRTGLMREWQMADPPVEGMIGPDGLHHTDRGYACVAASLGQAIITAAGKGVPVADVKKK